MNSREIVAVVPVGLNMRPAGVKAVERTRHDGGEGRHDQQQRQIGEDQEQTLRPNPDVLGNNFTDGSALVPDGGDERAVVMHGAEKDAADENPQQTGQPAEKGRLNGAVDRSRASDG